MTAQSGSGSIGDTQSEAPVYLAAHHVPPEKLYDRGNATTGDLDMAVAVGSVIVSSVAAAIEFAGILIRDDPRIQLAIDSQLSTDSETEDVVDEARDIAVGLARSAHEGQLIVTERALDREANESTAGVVDGNDDPGGIPEGFQRQGSRRHKPITLADRQSVLTRSYAHGGIDPPLLPLVFSIWPLTKLKQRYGTAFRKNVEEGRIRLRELDTLVEDDEVIETVDRAGLTVSRFDTWRDMESGIWDFAFNLLLTFAAVSWILVTVVVLWNPLQILVALLATITAAVTLTMLIFGVGAESDRAVVVWVTGVLGSLGVFLFGVANASEAGFYGEALIIGGQVATAVAGAAVVGTVIASSLNSRFLRLMSQRKIRRYPDEEILDSLPLTLGALEDHMEGGTYATRAELLHQLEYLALVTESRTDNLGTNDVATADWARQRAEEAAHALREQKREVLVPSDGSLLRVRNVLITYLKNAARGNWSALQPESEVPQPPQRRSVTRFGLVALLVVVPLAAAVAMQAWEVPSDSDLRASLITTSIIWGAVVVLTKMDPGAARRVTDLGGLGERR